MRFRDHHRCHRHSRWESIGAFLRHPAQGTAVSLRRILNSMLSSDAGGINSIKELYRSHDPAQPKELGSFLKQTRLAHRMSLTEAGARTRLKTSYLEAIEEGDFDVLPGGLFNKTFVRMYASHLGISVTALKDYYEVLPQESAPVESPAAPPQIEDGAKISKAKRPPRLAEYMLYLFLTKSERVNLIGDTEEEYVQVLEKFGKRAANGWYYKQVFDSLRPLIKRSITKIGIVAGAWKYYSKINEYVQHLINIFNSK